MPETLFLAINLMDRYLSSQRDLTRTELQLVGIAAMLVACKYEEINVLCVQYFLNISNHSYTENDALQMKARCSGPWNLISLYQLLMSS